MADKDIIIEFKTKADTTGAEEVEKALHKVEEAAVKAEREIDDVESKGSKLGKGGKGGKGALGGLLGMDTGEGANKLAEIAAEAAGLSDQLGTLNEVIGKHANAMTASYAAIGASAVKAYQMLSETVDGYKTLMEEAAERGETLAPELVAQVNALEATLGPVAKTVEYIKEKGAAMWKVFTDPVGELSGMNALREATERQLDLEKKRNQARLEKNQQELDPQELDKLLKRYREENAELERQETLLLRLAGLRQERAGLQQAAAKQEVDFAKQRGGDVELAEINALSVELTADITRLDESITQSRNEVAAAQKAVDDALIVESQAIQQKLSKEEIAEFSKAADEAVQALGESKEILREQVANFNESKKREINDLDYRRAELEKEFGDRFSKAAKTAADNFYARLQEEAAKTEKDTERVVQVFADLKTSSNGFQTTVTQNTGELISLVRALAATVTAQQGEIAAMRIQIDSLR